MAPFGRAVQMQDGGKLEIFCGSNRFLCVTGNALEGHNRKPTIGTLDGLLEQFKPQLEPEPEPEDAEEDAPGECPAWIINSLHETTEPARSEMFYALWISRLSSSSPEPRRNIEMRRRASSWDSPFFCMAAAISLAIPIPAEPAPRNRMRWSLNGAPARPARRDYRLGHGYGAPARSALASAAAMKHSLESSRAGLSEAQKAYAHKAAPSKDLVETIEALKPTILIGVSTRGGAFNQRVGFGSMAAGGRHHCRQQPSLD